MKWSPSYRQEYDIDSWVVVVVEEEAAVEEELHHVVVVSAVEEPQLNLYLTLDLSVHSVARNDAIAASFSHFQVAVF
jgi:hypothetical protein